MHVEHRKALQDFGLNHRPVRNNDPEIGRHLIKDLYRVRHGQAELERSFLNWTGRERRTTTASTIGTRDNEDNLVTGANNGPQ